MTQLWKIDVKDGDLSGAVGHFLGALLENEDVAALLVPRRLPGENKVMPALVTDPVALGEIEPLAPSYPLNAARITARLTRKPTGKKVAALLRPCEMRAFVELVKLNQGSMEEVLLIGLDCLGAYTNRDYARFARGGVPESTRRFCRERLFGGKRDPDTVGSGKTDSEITDLGRTVSGGAVLDGIDLSTACRSCTRFIPENADIHVELLGAEPFSSLPVLARTPRGEAVLSTLGLSTGEASPERERRVRTLLGEREAFQKRMFAETSEGVNTLPKLNAWFAACVNCYNCRMACPVCYCKECVFVTDVFDHEPARYLSWAEGRGVIKMPTDTIFFHLTRLAHMSHACVGCGQCSNACPNDIKVTELFKMVAGDTQQAFDYRAGRSVDEPVPLSVFREKEFEDIVGM